MFCKYCGKQISSESKFCPHCGGPITEIEEAEKKLTQRLVKTSRIKCLNCQYTGEGLGGRSTWANILVLLLIPLAPIIPIIYFLVTPRLICPECKSKFIEEIDREGKVVKRKNIWLILLIIPASLAIIGISSSIVLVSLGGARTKARDARRMADVRQVATALEMYFTDNESYPAVYSWSGLEQALSSYFTPLPIDPLNEEPCIYTYSSDGTYYQITYCSESEGKAIKEITNYEYSF